MKCLYRKLCTLNTCSTCTARVAVAPVNTVAVGTITNNEGFAEVLQEKMINAAKAPLRACSWMGTCSNVDCPATDLSLSEAEFEAVRNTACSQMLAGCDVNSDELIATSRPLTQEDIKELGLDDIQEGFDLMDSIEF